MSFYLSVMGIMSLVVIFFRYLEIKTKRNLSTLYLGIYFIVIVLISGLRAQNVGTDTWNYQSIFNYLQIDGLNYYNFWKFPGYSLYNIFLSKINSNLQFITFMNSFIILLGFTISFKKMSLNPYLSSYLFVTLYIFFITMNATRQYLSIVFLLISLHFFIKNKKIYILYFILAVSFHQISIIGAAYFILYRINWSTKKYFSLALIVVFTSTFLDKFIAFFSSFFNSYDGYLSQDSSINLATSGSGNKVLLSLVLSIFIICGMYMIQKGYITDHFYKFLLSLVLISFVLDILYSKNIMMIRIVMYFNYFYIYFIPSTILYFSKLFNKRALVYSLMIILVCIMMFVPFYYQLSKNMVDVLPYHIFDFRT